MKKSISTDIYGITGEEYSRGRSNLEVVSLMIEAGVKLIQYREKEKTMKEKYGECLLIGDLCKKAGVCFIVNDHPDLALAVKADGVHIGQDDIPPLVVRKIIGKDMILGLSTHSIEEAGEAVKAEVDYIGVGPIFKTSTKKDALDPVGFEYLDYIVKNIKLPFVAIGGIKEENIASLFKRGVSCAAMISEIVGAEDIKEKVESIRRKIREVS